MRIAYLAEFDCKDITKRSGLGVNIAKALIGNGNALQYIDKLKASVSIYYYFKKIYYRALGRRFDFEREVWYAKKLSKIVTERLSEKNDVIFSLSSHPVAFLESAKPIVFYTDATFEQMVGFYFNNLSEETVRNGNIVEKAALDNCSLAIYASQWAADSAIKFYNIDPSKVRVVPRGANIDCNRTSNDVTKIINDKSKDILRLLFVGIDWYRKGGDVAYKIVEYLNSIGVTAELHVVGLKDIPVNPLPEYIVNHGFLNKSDPAQKELLEELYLTSHFFLLPTVADTFGIVFAEANSFGLPAISFNVGGISSVILDNVNGFCFEVTESSEVIAQRIVKVFKSSEAYSQLCMTSFMEYQNRLNWKTSGEEIQRLLTTLVSPDTTV